MARGHMSATKCYFVREDIRNEKMSLNYFPDKAEIDGRDIFKTEQLFICGEVY